MAMNFVVRKSTPIVVRPSEAVTTNGSGSLIKLSSFDTGLDMFTCTVLLAFEQPIHDTVDCIRRALSQALVHYYPFAGRLVAAADSDNAAASHIQCSNDGVVFVAASASCALKEIILSNDLPHELVIHYPDDHRCGGGGATDDRPLLLMQVTEISCGGFVIAVTWNHAVADGTGMGQFLQAIGELARGLPSPTIIPVRSVDSLPRVRADRVLPKELILPHLVPFSHFACFEIAIPSTLVGQIKDEFGSRFNAQVCTVFDTIAALIWHFHTRTTMSSDPKAPVLLLFAVDVRKHAGLKKGYYGSCISTEIVRAKSGTVARGDIIDLVKLINQSKQKIAEQLKNNTGSSCPFQVPYNVLAISSWRNLGLHEADFGSERPVRVAHCECAPEDQPGLPNFVLLPECKGKDGAITLSAKVKKEHSQAFLRELARFTSLTTISSVIDAL